MMPAFKLFVVLVVSVLLGRETEALWPQPRNIRTGAKALRLANDFKVNVAGHSDSDLDAAISRTQKYLNDDKLGRLVLGRGSGDAVTLESAAQLHTLTLSWGAGAKPDSISQEAKAPIESRDEAYTLTIPDDGSAASLSANSSLGLFRGLTTFSQLWYTHQDTTYALDLPLTIEDSPAYPYRGLMLDTARNYLPVDVLKRQLDSMSWVKINTFHWHIVDSQSFPLVVPGFEVLSQKGAYSADMIYSPKDVADIVSYAAARGIDVIVEIDTPGHTSVISKSFPEHIACPGASPWSKYAAEPPSGQLRITSPNTTEFTAELISSVADLFPSHYFSTGGDEINSPCYEEDEETQNALNSTGKSFDQALDTFTQATHGVLKDKGKTAVVWEEMVLTHNVTLANDTIVLVWISSENAAGVVEKGFRLIHGPSDYFYLDCGAGEWISSTGGADSWCDPFKTWQKAYSFDPLANITTEQAHLVLGGQQLLWTEQSSPSNIDSIVWPRAAASAELFWSGAGGDASAALPRLHDIAFRMAKRGVNAIALQPLWCALRPGTCDLTA